MMKIKFGPRELRRIKGVVSGGDIVNTAMKTRFNDFLAAHGSKAMLHNGYGLTEAAGGMVFSPASIARGDGVIGYPLPDSEVMIVDLKTGKPTQTGHDGEIYVRGLTVMYEYLGDPKETRRAFVEMDGKKWLKTGDVGYVDDHNVVYFKTRVKRMIITNGYNVYPVNIEDATMKCNTISACACVGIPDELRGEIVKVFVILKPGASERATRKDLSKIYKKYLAKYETPRAIEFIDEFPKTKLGKIDFLALQNRK